MLVPICNEVRHLHLKEYGMRMDYVFLLSLCGSGGLYFSTFDAPLLRLKQELAANEEESNTNLGEARKLEDGL